MAELTINFRTSFAWWFKPVLIMFCIMFQLLPIPSRNLWHFATAILMKGVKVTQCPQ